MSNVGKFKDPIPFIHNAGITLANSLDATSFCVQPDIYYRVIIKSLY